MKTHRLQAAFARKRELDHLRTQRSTAVDRYYDHWGKVTSKYENWTAPEYYKQAEETVRKNKEKIEKAQKLQIRQEKLKSLLMQEKKEYEEQLADLRRPKSRRLSENVMQKIDQNFKAKQDDRRRLELEAKLFGRLRHGIEDESLLYESKSNNQVLAKLNWLDKQIEEQVQREEEEKFNQNQTLRLQEEIRKTEESHRDRQEIREKEIREIRALQEKHMDELKKREQESESLKLEANCIHNSLEQINKELDSLDCYKSTDFNKVPLSNNLRKIKMIIRKRSEAFRDQLFSDINLLKRVNETIPSSEKAVECLMEKLEQQYDSEMKNVEQIDSMYESEAKVNLHQCEEAWRQLSSERHLNITNLLKQIHDDLSSKLYENQHRQKEVLDIRSTHLMSIENSNDKLKLLIKENEDSPTPPIVESPRSLREPSKSLQKISNSFTNLNLDCLSGNDIVSQPPSSRSQLAESTSRPKFGRKKVAWV